MNYSVIESATHIILDRDGVINKKANLVTGEKYILRSEDLEIYSDFFEFATWAEGKNKVLIVATNQQGLALDLLLATSLDAIHAKIQAELQLRRARSIDRFYVCGHLDGECDCRKPAPGLLLTILSDYNIPKSSVVFVGDSLSDKLAADRADVRFVQMHRDPNDEIFAIHHISSFEDLIGMVG